MRYCAVLLVALLPAAYATTVYATLPGAMDAAGQPVNAEADFTIGSGTLTIVLSNLLVNQTDVAQNISDLFFTLSKPGSTLGSGSIANITGAQIVVAENGTT